MAERTPDANPPSGGSPRDPLNGERGDVQPVHAADINDGVGESTAARASREQRQRDAMPEPEIMPRWVPVLIGVILLTMAGLAVFTGFRFRQDDFARITRRVTQTPPANVPAPPGEPDAGGSLVMSNGGAPAANEPVSGSSRAVVSGGPGGVDATVRMWARRGMTVQATPTDAMVYVNDVLVGHASQFDTPDEIYEFAEPGSYTIRINASGFKERQYVVTAAENAEADVATIAAKLDRQ
jgi:hypothetical protein